MLMSLFIDAVLLLPISHVVNDVEFDYWPFEFGGDGDGGNECLYIQCYFTLLGG